MITDVRKGIKDAIKGRVSYDEPLKNHTSFRIGGPAEIWIEPLDEEDLRRCVNFSVENNIPLFILGCGTNVLVKDEGINGIVVNMTSSSLKKIYADADEVTATSSVRLAELLRFSYENGLGGLEFLSGVPGSVGGAVATNAGARDYNNTAEWHSAGDVIKEIKVTDNNTQL